MRKKLKNCRGITDLILAGVALPVILLTLGLSIDIARYPLVRNYIRGVISDAAFPSNDDLSQGLIVNQFKLDGTLTDNDVVLKAAADPVLQQMCDSALAKVAYYDNNCAIIGSVLTSAAGLTKYGFRFALFNASDNTILAEKECIAQNPTGCPQIDALNLADFPLSALEIQTRLENQFALDSEDASKWNIIGMPVKVPPDNLLPSYWILGVGYTEIHYLLGSISGNDPRISEYVARPLPNVAGIAAGS